MMLRLLLLLAAVFVIASLFKRRVPQGPDRALQRKRAWASAMRQTAYTVAAFLFVAITLFSAWHSVRFEDRTAAYLALVTGPLALLMGWLALRATRP